MQDTFFHKNHLLNCRGRLLDVGRPVVMGILNLTPDSFYDGGKFTEEEAILKQVTYMLDQGASIIDVGAASSRPGAGIVSEKEEQERLLPALDLLVKQFPQAIFSVDTCQAMTAEKAIVHGAHIINDISAGMADPKMLETIASMQVPYIMMHMQGTPATMQQNPVYEDVVEEVIRFFIGRLEKLRKLYVHDIILDPGFGFGKTVAHNFKLLNALDDFRIFELPVMAGLSRKSMICKTLGVNPGNAQNGTTALHVLALQGGANILRVHDVKEAMETIKLVLTARQFSNSEAPSQP